MADNRDGAMCSIRQSKKAVAKILADRHASFYNMKHKNRGRALIFNHMYFSDEKPRSGTEHDVKNLVLELERLKFDVSIYENYDYEKIQQVINVAAAQDHSDSDCILITVLSHGKQGYIHARDIEYQVENIWDPFTADKCPSLAGKPKLFIIQACQGIKLDNGFTMKSETIETDSDSWSTYKIPVYADFLIAYSTLSGYLSWRSPQNGSWFIQSLCAELAENGLRLDLLTLLTFVCQRVAIDFESNTPDNLELNGKKQIPFIATMLTRILLFENK